MCVLRPGCALPGLRDAERGQRTGERAPRTEGSRCWPAREGPHLAFTLEHRPLFPEHGNALSLGDGREWLQVGHLYLYDRSIEDPGRSLRGA